MNDGDSQQRGTNWLTVVCIATIAIVLFAAVGYVLGSRAMPGNSHYDAGLNVTVPGIEPDNNAIPAYTGPPVVDQSNVTAPSAAASNIGSSANPMDASVARDDGNAIDDNGEPVPPQAAASGADRQGSEEIARAIHGATMNALDQGGSARWKKDGLSGYAVAGAAITIGQQTCREAYSTTLRDDGETRGPSLRWCRTGDDGAWQQR